MKIFTSNQEYFAALGITRYQVMQYQSFNARKLRSFRIFILIFSFFAKHLFCEANNFREYTKSIYFTSASIAVTIIFLVFIWNIKDFFNFVDGWEKCVEQS